MCTKTPKAPPAQPPAAPPPPPAPLEFGNEKSASSTRKKATARNSLSVPLSLGGMGGSTGLGIPS